MMNAGYQIRIWQKWEGLNYAAQFQRAEKWISMAPFELYYENEAGESQAIGRPADASPELNLTKTEITWPNAFGKGIHFRYVLGADRFYKVVIVDSPSALPVPTIDSDGIKLTVAMKLAWTADLQNSAGLEKYVPHDTFSANKGAFVLQERVNPGKINFKDSLQRDMFWMQKPRAWDSSEPDNITIEVEDRLLITEEGIIALYGVNVFEINDAIYPLYVDATIQISEDTNDCINQSAEFRLHTKLSCGDYGGTEYDFETGVRFASVPIGREATIISAYLNFYGQNQIGSIPDTKIYGQDSDDTVTFSTQSDFTNRPRTTAYEDWTPSSWSLGGWPLFGWNTSPNIKDVIQEIVDRGSWQGGNALVLFWKDAQPGNQGYSRIFAFPYEDDASKAPKIEISSSGGSPYTATPTPTPTITPTFTPTQTMTPIYPLNIVHPFSRKKDGDQSEKWFPIGWHVFVMDMWGVNPTPLMTVTPDPDDAHINNNSLLGYPTLPPGISDWENGHVDYLRQQECWWINSIYGGPINNRELWGLNLGRGSTYWTTTEQYVRLLDGLEKIYNDTGGLYDFKAFPLLVSSLGPSRTPPPSRNPVDAL